MRKGMGYGSGKARGRLTKDKGGHSTPGRTGQDGSPGMWPARTGYTSENRIGGSKAKSRQGVSFPKQ